MQQAAHYAIVGTGTWGTATASLIASANPDAVVTLWGRSPDTVEQLGASRQHHRLGEHHLADNMMVTAKAETLAAADCVFWAVPTQHTRAMLHQLAPHLSPQQPLISLSKGLEQDSGLRVTEIFADAIDHACAACLSGPSHAEEVINGQPCALACAGPATATEACVEALHGGHIRIYTTSDLVGVELGGALKNVIAIAAGIADGMHLGDNAKAALITRGLAEIRRLGRAMGADDTTFAGLAGIGDLLTTCYSPFGRNRALGLAIASGETLQAHLAKTGMVAEGAWTAKVAVQLGNRHGVELPIASQVASMVWDGKPVAEAIHDLLSRSNKEEDA